MSSIYLIEVSKSIGSYIGESMYMAMIVISIPLNKGSRFYVGASTNQVLIRDSSIGIASLTTLVSPNRKELIAYFTNDVFTQFSGNVDIEFFYGEELLGSFTGINPLTDVQPLDPSLAGLNIPIATNAWLATL